VASMARFIAAFVLLGLALVWLAVRIAEVRLSLWGVASLIVTFAVAVAVLAATFAY
jgi:hypothetical protein